MRTRELRSRRFRPGQRVTILLLRLRMLILWMSLPRSFFYAVRVTGMLDTQLVINNLYLLNFLSFKKHPVINFHADSFHDTVIIKKNPENEIKNKNPKKNFFRVGMDILPDCIYNLFHASKHFWLQSTAKVTAKKKHKRNPFKSKKGSSQSPLYPESLLPRITRLITKFFFNTE